ncbi:MAG: hypothetical protein AABX00_02210 [Nanoarchaeota archaeon]
MELSKREKRKLKLEGLRQESHKAQQEFEQRTEKQKQFEPEQKKSKWKIYGAIAIAIIIVLISFSAYSAAKPGRYDNFARCLTSKGAVVYGAIDWCKYTQAQRAMFGNSWKYLNYQDFTKLQGIRKTPTWVIGGKWYENVQTFDRLSELTGCR